MRRSSGPRNESGGGYIIPTLGVWEHFDDIDFDALPNQFVLKCTHDSGSIVIVKDKAKMDRPAARKKLESALRRNMFWFGREWPYKNVPPRIIAEKYMEDESGTELKDYKFMCFDGAQKCAFVCSERFTPSGLKVTFYDTDWEVMPFERHYPKSEHPVAKPATYDEMAALAEELSKDIPFARVDFYEVNGASYFGELTLYPGNGMEEFSPSEWDERFGQWLKLPGGGTS